MRVGEPTEAALKVLCEKLGAPTSLDASPEAKQAGPWHRASLAWAGAYERTATLEFDRGRKSMSVVCRRHGSYARLFVKGAPDSVLARCSRGLHPTAERKNSICRLYTAQRRVHVHVQHVHMRMYM